MTNIKIQPLPLTLKSIPTEQYVYINKIKNNSYTLRGNLEILKELYLIAKVYHDRITLLIPTIDHHGKQFKTRFCGNGSTKAITLTSDELVGVSDARIELSSTDITEDEVTVWLTPHSKHE